MLKNTPRLSFCIRLFACLAFLCCLPHRVRAQQADATTVPYVATTMGGQPLVQVLLNNRYKATFLLDTGCTWNLISEKLARQMGLTLKNAVDPAGNPVILEGKPQIAVEVEQWKIGELSLPTAFVVADAKHMAQFHSLLIDGILGMDGLTGKTLFIDPKQHQITFWTHSLSQDQRKSLPLAEAYVCQAHLQSDNLLYLSAHLNAHLNKKVVVDMLLDTGATGMMIPAAAARQLTPPTSKSLPKKGSVQTYFGKLPLLILPLETVTFDTVSTEPLEVLHPTVTYLEKTVPNYGDAQIGMDMLGFFYTLIDVGERKVYFQSIIGRQSNVGLGLEVDLSPENKVMILKTDAGSSAQEAGLMAGDEIVKINGVALPRKQEVLVKELQKQLQQSEGAQVKLTVKRKGEAKMREVTLTFRKLP